MELLTKLGINWQMIVAQIINFFILLWVLNKFIYKPFLALLDQRSERVRKAMADADNLEEKTRALESERQTRLKQIDEEAGQLLAEARKQAEVIEKDLIEKARRESDRLIEQGRQEIDRERKRALQDLQKAAAAAIVTLTETLLRREFKSDDQQKIMKEIEQKIPALLK